MHLQRNSRQMKNRSTPANVPHVFMSIVRHVIETMLHSFAGVQAGPPPEGKLENYLRVRQPDLYRRLVEKNILRGRAA